MDDKLADLLDAKEGVDEAAPEADIENKYLKKKPKFDIMRKNRNCMYN